MTGPIEVIEPAGQGQGTIVRMSPPNGTASAARREGTAWVIDVGQMPRTPDVPVQVTVRGNDPASTRVVAELSDARSILNLRDPEIGDEIAVAPTAAAGAGVENERIYPQFRLLATAQGVAVQKLADKLAVRAAGNSVEVSSADGLHVSDNRDANARLPRAFRAPALFDLSAWRRSGPSRFTRIARPSTRGRRCLERKAKRRPPRPDAVPVRLRPYGGCAGPAAADRAGRAEPGCHGAAARDPRRRLADGGDREEARRNLTHQSLDSQSDAALWRGALAMAQGDARTARAPRWAAVSTCTATIRRPSPTG